MMCCVFRFQYILGAATSPAVKMNEETLTYLNQGQCQRLNTFYCSSYTVENKQVYLQ